MAYIGNSVVGVEHPSTSALNATTGDFTGAVDIDGAITSSTGATITTADNNPQITLTSTDTDAGHGPRLNMVRNPSEAGADGDNLGQIFIQGYNDAGTPELIDYFQLFTEIADASDGTEDARQIHYVMTGGSQRSRIEHNATETVINEDSVDVDFRVESNGNANMLVVDGGNNRVGIGTGSPVNILDVIGNGSGAAVKGRIRNEGGASGDDATLELSIATASEEMRILFTDSSGTAGQIVVDGGDNSMAFETGASEGMRLDSSGNFLVGKTASGSFDQGSAELNNTGYLQLARDDGANIFIDRQGSSNPEGAMITLHKAGTEIGRIGVKSSRMFMGSSTTGLAFEGSQADSIYPISASGEGSLRDNAIDLGFASSRFDDVHATNGTIQTSDENEKQNITSLTSAEITAAKAISKLFKTYKWKDKVTAKGDAARTHTGVVAQEVQAAMSAAGLDASKYAFWCSDTWWEASTEVAAVEAVEVADAVYDDDGNEVSPAVAAVDAVEARDAYTRIDTYNTESEAPEGATKRTRLGVRYPELLAFVGAATEQRLADIETRLTALENA